ncbi:MAG: hypothetical protein H7X93_04355, partial [Sphingomonadaceae bacterium]|nr:hypothetical protein [Sphingomonadaceae bacterium]
WAEAAAAFGRAADHARGAQDPALPMLLGQAGNASLAAGDAAAAKTRFDEALGVATITPNQRGQTLIDRARAHVQLGDGNAAQADLIQAQALVPSEPMVWLFSATLARIQNDLDAAGEFIDHALELDREHAAINLEAGNIAYRMNAPDIARQAWVKASANDPEGAAGEAARANLAQLDAQMAENVPVDVRENSLPAPAPEPSPPDQDAPQP